MDTQKFKAEFKYGKREDDKAQIEFEYSDSFFELDNSAYHKELSTIACLFANNSYYYCDDNNCVMEGCSLKFTDKSKKDSQEATIAELPHGLGFSNCYYYEMYSEKELLNETGKAIDSPQIGSIDSDDTTGYLLSHKTTKLNGKKSNIVIAAIRGTNGTLEEWRGNFEIGADSEEYYKFCGNNHPDWSNKENHKSYDIAATRAMLGIKSYISHICDPKIPLYILFTGHSRGASISNILGAKIAEDKFFNDFDVTPFVYTFASPNSTCSDSAEDFDYIFNIVNTDDAISRMPVKEIGFKKYGKNKVIRYSEELKKDRPRLRPIIDACKYDCPDERFNKEMLDGYIAFDIKCRDDLYAKLTEYRFPKRKLESIQKLGLNKWIAENKDGQVKLPLAYEYDFLAYLASNDSMWCFKNCMFRKLDGPFHEISRSLIKWTDKARFPIINLRIPGYKGKGPNNIPHFPIFYLEIAQNIDFAEEE